MKLGRDMINDYSQNSLHIFIIQRFNLIILFFFLLKYMHYHYSVIVEIATGVILRIC